MQLTGLKPEGNHDDDWQLVKITRFVYHVLVHCMDTQSTKVVRATKKDKNGLETLRLLEKEYHPLRPETRGTLQDAVNEAAKTPTKSAVEMIAAIRELEARIAEFEEKMLTDEGDNEQLGSQTMGFLASTRFANTSGDLGSISFRTRRQRPSRQCEKPPRSSGMLKSRRRSRKERWAISISLRLVRMTPKDENLSTPTRSGERGPLRATSSARFCSPSAKAEREKEEKENGAAKDTVVRMEKEAGVSNSNSNNDIDNSPRPRHAEHHRHRLEHPKIVSAIIVVSSATSHETVQSRTDGNNNTTSTGERGTPGRSPTISRRLDGERHPKAQLRVHRAEASVARSDTRGRLCACSQRRFRPVCSIGMRALWMIEMNRSVWVSRSTSTRARTRSADATPSCRSTRRQESDIILRNSILMASDGML